ncbi:hypothetical protein TraAM80_03898 [Trypanosoma rangeli]|uniref:Uncharacterized protein n=1 Tax=Trypanosoma rangeli TaxID=5698 RepID=A0A3S5IRF6_TRYRA|nr:uncharacterized protein TraAM80_03898 [Trypanosoma rangeli]RNF06431.1 hypothetical protein TraAM80_03898 [Trypanosoma rangeli]|eukprot:RNF06431.1 hypothetical protein TraAM80_03898 [Trypanosoma rangeli]
MVLPPCHVYSALVKNTAPIVVKVKATYAMPNNMADVEVEVPIGPGETTPLEQKTVQVDQMTLTGHICRISVEGGALLEAPFSGVSSPVKDYVVEVHSDGGALRLHAMGKKLT